MIGAIKFFIKTTKETVDNTIEITRKSFTFGRVAECIFRLLYAIVFIIICICTFIILLPAEIIKWFKKD